MADRHCIGVYWEDRLEARGASAATVVKMIESLRLRHPLLATWYPRLATREESLAAKLEGDAAQALVESAIAPADPENTAHGWKLTLWNGHADGTSAIVELKTGAHIGTPFAPTPNSCLVRLPRAVDDPQVASLLEHDCMVGLVGDLARVWVADWGIASTESYFTSVIPRRPPHHPRVGWITFLHGRRGSPPRSSKRIVAHAHDLGFIVSTGDVRFSSDDSAAVSRMEDLEDALAEAGKLTPIGETHAHEAPEPRPQTAPTVVVGASSVEAALDVAVVVDAIAARIPARRGDLARDLLQASSALLTADACGGDVSRAAREVRALLALVGRLFPAATANDLASAHEALGRVDGG
jgi:hypothetical protein